VVGSHVVDVTNQNSSPHGSTGPTIDARPNDGAFVATVAVPVVVITAIWLIGTPTAAVGAAGIVVGAAGTKYDVSGRVVGETPPTIRRSRADTDGPATSNESPTR
jgi:hypothetical protein